MQPNDDSTLLRRYAETQSDEAFAQLVARYLNLVYSVALRQVGQPHRADEITQAVFIILAKKAPQLRHHQALSSWLFQTTRLTANNFLRGEIRRQRREQEAYMQSTLNEPTDEAWTHIAPLLDAAVAGLSEKDRRAILLRFYEGRSLRDAGLALGASEAATEKRVSRAVEKLRAFFHKRGIVLSAAAIAAAASANSVSAAPAGLAATISAVAAAKGATASVSTLTLIKGALKVMAWTKAKTTALACVGLLLAAGTATVAVREIASDRREMWQEKYDLAVVDQVPPQVKILPSAKRAVERHIAGQRHGKILGFGKSFSDVILAAYRWKYNEGQLIFSVPVPDGQYDYISNLRQGQSEALQQEIKRKFGLVARPTIIETNILILQLRSANAAGLRTNTDGKVMFSAGPGAIISHGQSLYSLVAYLRGLLGTLVIDHTGFKGDFDIDLQWDERESTEGLKQQLLDQLGLELVPSSEFVDFLVVEKAN